MTGEDLEEPSGGERENWFEEGSCPALNKVEKQSASNCRRNEVNLGISGKGTILDTIKDMMIML